MTFDDVLAGVRAAWRLNPGGQAPVVLGHSAGGHLALRVAPEMAELAGVVALAPVAALDLADELNLGNGAVRDFLGGEFASIPAIYEAADPSRHASQVERLCIHGASDDVVPLALSAAFVERRKNDAGRVRLIELPDTDHFDVIDPTSKVWATVEREVLRLCGDRFSGR